MNTQLSLSNVGPRPGFMPGLEAAGRPPGHKNSPSANEAAQTFGQALGNALQRVNAAQQEADHLAVQLVTDENTDIAAVMVATERAHLTFQLAVEVRNKVLEAYQEIMRMQV